MPTAANRSGAIPALTGLRFVAALMVFFSHYPIQGTTGWIKTFQLSGYSGVTFFFILSGFMLTYNYLPSLESSAIKYTPRYLLSRFARVYPLYAICVLYAWATTDSAGLLIKHLLLAQAWYGDVDIAMGLNGPGWSISVEALLYLAFPLLIPALSTLGITSDKPRLLIFAALVMASIFGLACYFWISGLGELSAYNPSSAHRWLYRTPVTRLLDFCLGISAAVFYIRFATVSEFTYRAWSVTLVISLATLIFLMGWRVNYLSPFGWDASYAPIFTLVILGIAMTQGSTADKALSAKFMVLLGESSYAFYLIHTLVRDLYPESTSFNIFQSLITQAYFLLLVIALSIAAHILVEKPARGFILRGLHQSGERHPKAI